MFVIYTAASNLLTMETTVQENIRYGDDPTTGSVSTRQRPLENGGELLLFYNSLWYCMEAEP